MVMESGVRLVEDGENDSNPKIAIEDESEEEDVDFNPFLKESLSEASSSLSSETEGIDNDVVNSRCVNGIENDDLVIDVDNGGRIEGDFVEGSILGLEKEDDRVEDRENTQIDVVEDVLDKERKVVIDFDNEDAICKRTRARYSLASFTLDELETFLQESDDDEDVQNVDEEEEYKKFLAAVLGGGNGDDNRGNFEGGNEEDDDDDDEDNDADFEIEIEDALESDIDDCVEMFIKENKLERGNRRPETRQKGRQMANVRNKTKDLRREKMPLRPLVPIVPASPVSCVGPRSFALEIIPTFSSYGQDQLLFGFQAHQIGQLYCLIYEHVQLLVQVYSLSVLEPARQNIATQMKGLLSELLHKRDLVLAWRKESYPSSCFHPSFIRSLVSVENRKFLPFEDSGASPSDGQGSQWLPDVGNSVVSVLDVAPLKLVEKYMDGVSNAVREHQRRFLETTNLNLVKQPLFPHPICSSLEQECDISEGNVLSPNSNEVSPNNRAPKKTLASTLVESTKKQSIALVSSEIAELAQPFYSLFNPSLFPLKPPSSAIANRVLFTDAEDVLVAMGIMEYNTDFKAIQQRFLPCKSEHQIFVRAKNRRSSKAPENPIKTVWKMKTSPLTEEEKVRIQEGLKTFKLDWMSVWKFVVPYRDPQQLRRQWRTAIGIQKSYKGDFAKRERRRIYEARRRACKMGAMDYSSSVAKENVNGEDNTDNNNEPYVHEAFLADWRPTPFRPDPSNLPISNLPENFRGSWPLTRACDSQKTANNYKNQGSHSEKGQTRDLPFVLKDSHLICHKSSTLSSKTFPRNSGKCNGSNLVKLAPDLPPVKLPSAVRVISQSSLRNSHLGSTSEARAIGQSSFDHSTSLVKPSEKHTETDPQMHPLLFRTIEEGQLPYYPLHNSIRIPTFSFFPALQHQLNTTLVQNSCTVDQSFRSKEICLESSNLDFHPLLKRTKGFSGGPQDSDLTNSFLNTNLELSRDQFMEDIVYNAGVNAAEISTITNRPISPSPETNDLDLDIHLNSTCKKRKVSSIETTEKNTTFSSVNGTRVVEISNEKSDMISEPQLEVRDGGSHLETCVIERSNNGLCVDSNGGDNSLSEIVMEQEELSDSDEELEDVEFEREEMEDSDGEEDSGSEHVDITHLKEKSSIGLGIDNPAQPSKSPLISETSQGTQGQKKGRKPRIVSTRAHTKSSWLSLNSNNSHLKPLTRTRKAESSERGSISSHPNQQSKKGISGPKEVSSEQNTGNQQDPFFNALRKPRKHSKSSSPLRVALPSGISSCTDKDGKV